MVEIKDVVEYFEWRVSAMKEQIITEVGASIRSITPSNHLAYLRGRLDEAQLCVIVASGKSGTGKGGEKKSFIKGKEVENELDT